MLRGMNNKLKMNKPSNADLASLSVYPPSFDANSRHVGTRSNTSAWYESCCNRSINTRLQPKFSSMRQTQTPMQSLIDGSSQSQHESLSQGLTQSQNSQQFSQNSQDPSFVYDQWKLRSKGMTNRHPTLGLPPIPSQEQSFSQDDNNSRLTLASSSATNNLLHKINNSCWPQNNCAIPKELEQRLDSLEEILNRIVALVENVLMDVKDQATSTREAATKSEGVIKKLDMHENFLHMLMNETGKIETTVSEGLEILPEMKADHEKCITELEILSKQLERLPNVIVEQLTVFKTEAFSVVQSHLIQASVKTADQRDQRDQRAPMNSGLRGSCSDYNQGKNLTVKSNPKGPTLVNFLNNNTKTLADSTVHPNSAGFGMKNHASLKPPSLNNEGWVQTGRVSSKWSSPWGPKREETIDLEDSQAYNAVQNQGEDDASFCFLDIDRCARTYKPGRHVHDSYKEEQDALEARRIREKLLKARKRRHHAI